MAHLGSGVRTFPSDTWRKLCAVRVTYVSIHVVLIDSYHLVGRVGTYYLPTYVPLLVLGSGLSSSPFVIAAIIIVSDIWRELTFSWASKLLLVTKQPWLSAGHNIHWCRGTFDVIPEQALREFRQTQLPAYGIAHTFDVSLSTRPSSRQSEWTVEFYLSTAGILCPPLPGSKLP